MIVVAAILFALLIVAWLVAPGSEMAERVESVPQLQPDPTTA